MSVLRDGGRPFAGVLLTGGASRRFGRAKATLAWRGTTLAQFSADELTAVCSVVIEVGDGLTTLRSVREDPPMSGPLAALVAGVDALGAELQFSGVLLLACDYPMIDRQLLSLVRDAEGDSAIPVDADRPQYGCAKYSTAVIAQARQQVAQGERSFRWIRDYSPIPSTVWTQVAPSNAFHDIDTPDDAVALGIDPAS